MAPRVRTKKRGNLRIDAALDAMNPFGFPPKLVRDTVKELLSVYGGDDGWVFIEEGSYTLLIDTLLEKRKDGGIEKVPENGRAEEQQETSGAGCSSGVADETSSSNPGAELTVKQSDDVLISSYVDNEALRTTTTLPANDSGERYWRDHGDDDQFRTTLNQSSPAHCPKISRRKPYHGWISKNEDADLVYLTPAPLPEEFARLLMMPHSQRKRKKRWDVKASES